MPIIIVILYNKSMMGSPRGRSAMRSGQGATPRRGEGAPNSSRRLRGAPAQAAAGGRRRPQAAPIRTAPACGPATIKAAPANRLSLHPRTIGRPQAAQPSRRRPQVLALQKGRAGRRLAEAACPGHGRRFSHGVGFTYTTCRGRRPQCDRGRGRGRPIRSMLDSHPGPDR